MPSMRNQQPIRLSHLGRGPRPRRPAALPIALTLLAVLTAIGGFRSSTVLAATRQQAAPASAEVTLDRTQATIGDPINLTIAVHYSAGVQVNVTNLTSQFAPFEAIASDPPNDQKTADGGVLSLHFQVAVYQTGALPFPALQIPYTLDGQSASIQTQPIPFTVRSVIPPGDPASDIRPLKPQLDLALPGPPPLLRIGIAALLLVLLAAAVVVWRRRRRQPPVLVPVIAPPPPEEAARAELERIAAQSELGHMDYVTQYALIAACIRRYITERYGFQASALTTTELAARMVASGVGRWRARLVADLLTECDAVHYAHYVPAPARAEADLQMAFEIVDLSLSQQTRQEDTRVEVGG